MQINKSTKKTGRKWLKKIYKKEEFDQKLKYSLLLDQVKTPKELSEQVKRTFSKRIGPTLKTKSLTEIVQGIRDRRLKVSLILSEMSFEELGFKE